MGCGRSKVAPADLVREITEAANETLEMETCLKTRLEAVENRQEDGFTRNQQSERTLLQRGDVVNRELNTKVETAERNVLSKLIEVQETDDSETDEELDKNGNPKLRPPRTKKQELITDVSIFQGVDNFVKNTPNDATVSVELLARHLTSRCKTDLEKVRAFVCWIAINIKYDSESLKLNYEQRPSQDSQPVLDTRKAVCRGFSQLFVDLCREANIPCTLVEGHDKGGADYKHTNEYTEKTKVKHCWNVLYVQGDWRLLDVTWAAKKDSEQDDDDDSEQDIISEHYFLTDPEEFIADHFPVMGSQSDSQAYQLLSPPIDVRQFSRNQNLTWYGQSLGVQLDSHPHKVVDIRRDVTIKMHAKRQPMKYIEATLAECTEDGVELTKERSGLMTSLSEDGACTIYVRPPRVATYLLQVTATHRSNLDAKTFETNEILNYVIKCKQTHSNQEPFPDKSGHWGFLQPVARNYGLKTNPGMSFEYKADEEGNVAVPIPLEHFTKLKVHLYHASSMKEDIAEYAYIECTNNYSSATIHARLTKGGYYQLRIFAGPPSATSMNMMGDILLHATHICKDTSPYPDKSCVLGLKLPLATECGLQVVDGYKFFINAEGGQAEIRLPLARYTEVGVMLYWKNVSSKENTDRTEFTMVEQTDGRKDGQSSEENAEQAKREVVIKARLPDPGYYKLSVFAKHPSQTDQLQHVADLLLFADRAFANCLPFPTAFPFSQEERAELLHPLIGQVSSRERTLYRLRAPTLFEVHVGESVMELKNDDTWEAEMTPSKGGKDVSIYGKKNKASTTLQGLYRFNVIG